MCVHVINDVHNVLLCSSHQAERRPASWQPSDSADGSVKQLVSTAQPLSHTQAAFPLQVTTVSVFICPWMSESVVRERKRTNEIMRNQTISSLKEFQLLWGVRSAHLCLRCSHFSVHLNRLRPATRTSWEPGEIKNVGRWQLMQEVQEDWVSSLSGVLQEYYYITSILGACWLLGSRHGHVLCYWVQLVPSGSR